MCDKNILFSLLSLLSSVASSGVLQKFKKTFSNFKNGKTTVPVGGDESNGDAKHHR